MYRKSLIVRTKLTPPRLHQRILRRPRLTRRLVEALEYRLTIVQAGAGYGKSTALADLTTAELPLVWYHLDAEDTDPFVFLHHLVEGFRTALPDMSEAPLALLDVWETDSSDLPWSTVIDVLVNEIAAHAAGPLFLILDDLHLLSDASIRILNWLIGRAPPDLHIILSTRYPPDLPALVTWRVRGEVLEIGQDELAFTPQETAALFHEQYGLSPTPEQVEKLASETDGWAIALQLVCQGLRSGAVSALPQALGRRSVPMKDLFIFLAQDVLAQQPSDIQAFLLTTAVLRKMTAPVCNFLRDARDSDQLLRYLLENGLFAVDLGDGCVRYHHLFRDFLCHQLTPPAAQTAHRKAAAYWQQHGELEEAIYHLLAADAFEEMASILDQLGQELVRAGRLDTLSGWIGDLSPDVLENHPPLLVYLGDIARLYSRFHEALGWYRQAEERCRTHGDLQGVGQALRGQARVYLDTVNPSQAESLLQEALRLADGQEDRETRMRLLELMAENLLNLGRLEEAERFQEQARALREEGPGEAELAVRVMLRTGCLAEAQRLLEERAALEREEPVLQPRAHRETLLLLSLILSFQGQGEEAYRCALEGTERGQALNSPFITAVGSMRQGHTWLLRQGQSGYAEACRCFQDAIDLGNSLAVPRLKVEAYWGLCRAHGFEGEIAAAEESARRGIEIAQRAGDEWIAALIHVSLGAGYALARRYAPAAERLAHAAISFRECSDTYGETVARLWQCLVWQATDDAARLERGVDDLLTIVREHGYEFLFQRQVLLGPPDPRAMIPLLLLARDQDRQRAYAATLLAQLGLPRLELHPGYQLQVQTLGAFRVWRGSDEIGSDEWRREKTRQLFQLLVTHRQTMLDRDQIIELLWPQLDPEPSQRDFKVALSTLSRVLEPERKRNAPSAYILREGSLYGLRPGADLTLDADRFEELIQAGDALLDHDSEAALTRYREALGLYHGEYISECLYQDWCSEERERLLTLYLRTADRLAHSLVERAAWDEAIQVCQAILARDDCWEQAYRLMMTAYARLGNRAQCLRTYQRCVERLRQVLQVEPSRETTRLYESLVAS